MKKKTLIEAKKKEWLSNLEPTIDSEYLSSQQNFLDALREDVFSSGLEKVKELKKTGNSRIMYVSEHLSEQDFIEEVKLFITEKIPLPAVFGGSNLLVRGITKPGFFINNPLVINLQKGGLISIERELLFGKGEESSAYKRLFVQFLEGTENIQSIFSRNDTLIFNYGRSRDGKVRNYEFHTLGAFHNHSLKETTLDDVIFPISISMERCIEDNSFQFQNFIKKSRLPIIKELSKNYKWAESLNNRWIKQTGKFGAVADIFSFLVFYLRNQPRGEIYFDFGNPIKPGEYSKRDRPLLMQAITSEIHKNTRITPVSLISSILKAHPESTIYKAELEEKINFARAKIPGEILTSVYLSNSYSDEEVLNRGMLFLQKKRKYPAVRYDKKNQKYNIEKDSFLIEYYSNRILHHNLDYT